MQLARSGAPRDRAVHVVRSTLDLARSRQALLSVAQPALGAVLAAGGLPSARQIMLGLLAATTGYLAVFSLNDVLDRRIDERALVLGAPSEGTFDIDTVYRRHPIAAGELPLGFALAWVAVLGAVSAIAAYVLDPLCLALFAVAVALEYLYCALAPVSWLKTLVSGVMVGVGGLAGWAAVAPLDAHAVPLFAFLALWEIAGRNLPNDLADVETDSLTGVCTAPVVLGQRTAARLVPPTALAAGVAVAAFGMPLWALAVLEAEVAWAIIVPSLALAARPGAAGASAYFNRASILPALMLPVVIAAAELLR